MFCDQCGKPLNTNSKFCPSCGKPVVDTQEVSPITASELTTDSSLSISSPQGHQDKEIEKNNQRVASMTVATMVVGIIFFILILIVGIVCACIDVYNIIYHEDEIKTLFGNPKANLIAKLIVFVDGGLISASIKGLVDIGKGKSYEDEALTTVVCSIIGIASVAFFGGKEVVDFVDFIVTLVFSVVLIAMAKTNEKATAK